MLLEILGALECLLAEVAYIMVNERGEYAFLGKTYICEASTVRGHGYGWLERGQYRITLES
jgi:hypothetical protein